MPLNSKIDYSENPKEEPDQPGGDNGDGGLSEEIRGEIRRYKWTKRRIWVVFVLFVIAGVIFLWNSQRVSVNPGLDEGRRLDKDVAASTDGEVLAVVVQNGLNRTVLISKDSGVHFTRLASWTSSTQDSALDALALSPDKKTILAIDSPSIRIISTNSGEYSVLHLPDTIFAGSPKEIEVRFRPNSPNAYIFKSDHPVYMFDWMVDVRDTTGVTTLDIPHLIDLAFNKDGTEILLNRSVPGTSTDSLLIGPDLGQLKQVIFISSSRYILQGTGNLYFDQRRNRWFFSYLDALYSLVPASNNTFDLTREVQTRDLGYFLTDGVGGWYALLKDSVKIFSTDFTDSGYQVIPYANWIYDLAFRNDRLAHAVIENGKPDSTSRSVRFYLSSWQNGRWQLNPIMVVSPPDRLSFYLTLGATLVLLVLLVFLVVWAGIQARSIREQIGRNPRDNVLRPKSERPIGPGDKDLLGFDKLSEAIVGLIRNPETALPFTIVISGGWGSGKSSMMNLIRGTIKDRDRDNQYYTTWFNAWHMQDERSLLDTFLLHVIDCYERNAPYIFSPFRLTLAMKRFFRLNWVNQVALGFTLALLIPFVLCGAVKLIVSEAIIKEYLPLVNSYWVIQGRIFNFHDFSFTTFHSYTTVSGVLLALFSLYFLSNKFNESGLGAFVKLLPQKPFNLDVESRAVGYRENFKKEYWQIMDSAKKGSRLVVFIDDIDRIQGDKIGELLEAINFVSDAASRPDGISGREPNTIFVLGMFIQEVAKNLGFSLLRVNSNGIEKPDTAAAVQAGSRYIEKMVQMIVPVPFEENSSLLDELYGNGNNGK